MATVHPTASVSSEAELGEGVEIGPQCVLTGRVVLGAGVRLIGHVYLCGPVRIGPGTIVYPFVCLGYPGQDVKFKLGDPTAGVEVGASCILREHVTIHAATNQGAPTRIGDRVFMMVNTHVGHDGAVGAGVTMVNNSALGGHASVGEGAVLGGGALVHQFARIGRLAMMSGGIAVSVDVPPFCMVIGRNLMAGVNVVGMRRAGIPREHITEVRRAYRDIFRGGLQRGEMVAELEARGAGCPPVAEMARFVSQSKRAICPDVERVRESRPFLEAGAPGESE